MLQLTVFNWQELEWLLMAYSIWWPKLYSLFLKKMKKRRYINFRLWKAIQTCMAQYRNFYKILWPFVRARMFTNQDHGNDMTYANCQVILRVACKCQLHQYRWTRTSFEKCNSRPPAGNWTREPGLDWATEAVAVSLGASSVYTPVKYKGILKIIFGIYTRCQHSTADII